MQYIVIFNPEWCKWGRKWLYSLESCCHFSEGHHRVKVIYTKYSKHWPYTVAHTIDCVCRNSILLHSGLNPAWHFWLSTRFSCCLKMKSVENILGRQTIEKIPKKRPKPSWQLCNFSVKILTENQHFGSFARSFWSPNPTFLSY